MHLQAHWSKYLSGFNLIIISVLENSEPNPTHSLDDGMSILKRGKATMPASIHRITAQYSLLSNWHCPSELLPYQSQSSVDLSSWILKGSIPTSGINSERIPSHRTPWQSVRTMDPGPQWSTTELWTHLCSGFQKPLTLCSSILTQPPPCRTFKSDKDTPPSPHALLLAWTSFSYIKNYCKSCTTCSHC